MANRSNKAFVIAVVLHLLLFALLFTGYLISPSEPDPEMTPFELYDPPSEAQDQPAEAAQSEPEPEQRQVRQMEVPEFEIEEVDIAPSEARERPRPQPEPEPEPEPQPEPAPEPEPRRAEPEPEPERMTAAEFRQRHGAPSEPRPRQQPAPQPQRQVEAPRIDTSNIRRELQSAVTSESDVAQVSRLSASDQRQLQRYFDRLRVAIERSWDQPSSARRGMAATVRFSLASDGRISGAQVIRSSGSDEFDRSIVRAFERLGSFEPPPDGDSYTPNLTFRVDD